MNNETLEGSFAFLLQEGFDGLFSHIFALSKLCVQIRSRLMSKLMKFKFLHLNFLEKKDILSNAESIFWYLW